MSPVSFDGSRSFEDSPDRETFGYLANRLPGYPDTLSLHMDVHWQAGGKRPMIAPHESEHPLYREWVGGIGWDRAMELFLPCIHPTGFSA